MPGVLAEEAIRKLALTIQFGGHEDETHAGELKRIDPLLIAAAAVANCHTMERQYQHVSHDCLICDLKSGEAGQYEAAVLWQELERFLANKDRR